MFWDFNHDYSWLINQAENQQGYSWPEGTINHIVLMGIYTVSHLTTGGHTFCTSSHGTCAKIDEFLAHKTHLSKVKRTEIMESMLSDHDEIRSEITNR